VRTGYPDAHPASAHALQNVGATERKAIDASDEAIAALKQGRDASAARETALARLTAAESRLSAAGSSAGQANGGRCRF